MRIVGHFWGYFEALKVQWAVKMRRLKNQKIDRAGKRAGEKSWELIVLGTNAEEAHSLRPGRRNSPH
jgi:hypothetical protein